MARPTSDEVWRTLVCMAEAVCTLLPLRWRVLQAFAWRRALSRGQYDGVPCYNQGKEVDMVTIQLRGIVQEDGTVVLTLPADISPGEHEMVLVLPQEVQQAEGDSTNGVKARKPLRLRAYPVGLQDVAFTFRREDLYADRL